MKIRVEFREREREREGEEEESIGRGMRESEQKDGHQCVIFRVKKTFDHFPCFNFLSFFFFLSLSLSLSFVYSMTPLAKKWTFFHRKKLAAKREYEREIEGEIEREREKN